MVNGEFSDLPEMITRHQIERRFRLVNSETLPDRNELDEQYPSIQFRQGYFTTNDDEEIRIRAVNDQTFTLTQKLGTGINRVSREREIDQSEFDELWHLTEGSQLKKTRYYISLGGGKVAELDFFEGEISDFVLAEIKFGDRGEAEQFKLPDWLEKAGLVEVTDIAAFHNRNLARYRSYRQHAADFNPEERPMPTISPDRTSDAFRIMLDATKHIYSLYRREERQIFGNSAGHGPQETDAEHSWHVSFLLDVLWQNRNELGIDFGEGFDIASAMQQAPIHDLPEIWAKDVDAVTKNSSLITNKELRELEAIGLMAGAHPYLGQIALRALEYTQKKTPEAKLLSDLDKFAAMLMIICDNGKKWREQIGNTTSRDRHDSLIGKKILTPFGMAIWDNFSDYFDEHPELFAPETVHPLINSDSIGIDSLKTT